jgi:2-oxoglutarate dehydrogenase E2 component (dihydrolipoamide succinyltransferase)
MREISLPRLNSNDESYVLVEWLAGDGDTVAPDSPVAVVETSKTAEELVVDEGGVLQQAVAANTECAIGMIIGRLFKSEKARLEYLAAGPGATGEIAGETDEDVVFTRSAREAAGQLGIDVASLRALGKPVVRRRDVEEFATGRQAAAATGTEPASPDRVLLPPAQQAVGRVVSRSHHDIPAAFLAVRAPVDAALGLAARMAAGSDVLIGLPELLIKAVAGLRERFPLFFGSYQPGGVVSLVPGAHTGVTLDLGRGLYIPVIEHADTRSLTEIADIIADLRVSALRGSFRSSELSGGNITISLSNDTGIVLARPIVFPGQTCVLCLCGTQEELCRGGDGEIRTSRYVNLGITYDHRVVNGRDAALFLQEIARILADPEQLAGT